MKHLTRTLACALATLALCVALVSCGQTLSGTYSASIGSGLLGGECAYTFSGNKVTVTVSGEQSYSGTYEIKTTEDGDTITMSFGDSDAEFEFGGTVSFETTGDSIKIGGVTYKKK